ncbi:MAG: ATPase domain-containing protein, partial [Janthinobacterium lividum]
MARAALRFVCQGCGAVTPKWAGRCESCGEWNTVVEEPVEARAPGPGLGTPAAAASPGKRRRIEFVGLAGEAAPPARLCTGIAELDRVLGGGLVAASAILVGGDPGIGKSTLLLQAAASLSRGGP